MLTEQELKKIINSKTKGLPEEQRQKLIDHLLLVSKMIIYQIQHNNK